MLLLLDKTVNCFFTDFLKNTAPFTKKRKKYKQKY